MENEPSQVVRCRSCDEHVTGIKCGEDVDLIGKEQPERIVLLRCPECSTHFLVHHTGNRYSAEYVDWNHRRDLYPIDETGLGPRVPNDVAEAYEKAHQAFHSTRDFELSTGACRRTLDVLCKERNTAKKDLKDQLVELKGRGVLDAKTFAWANEIRHRGNGAVHAKTASTRQEAGSVLELTKAVLLNVYVYEGMFSELSGGRSGTPSAEAGDG